MNPFNVAQFITIFLNTKYLDIPEEGKKAFVDNIRDVVKNKFSEVSVLITTEEPLSKINVKEVLIHNSDKIDQKFGGDLPDYGFSEFKEGIAEVNVNEIQEVLPNIQDIAEATGTVVAHEAGHLLLPRGHSEMGANIMNKGSEKFSSELMRNGGIDLEFTPLQESIMNSGIQDNQQLTQILYGQTNLSKVENGLTENISSPTYGEVQNSAIELDSVPTNYDALTLPDNNLDIQLEEVENLEVIDSAFWGSFEPDSIDSFTGLGNIELDAEGFSSIIGSIADLDIDQLKESAGYLNKFDLPDFDLPDFDLPDFDLPDFDLPDFGDLLDKAGKLLGYIAG